MNIQVYRTETTISQDGKLSIKGLPFRKGDAVEVIVLTQKQKQLSRNYPLRGKPVKYHEPFDSVAQDEWDTGNASRSRGHCKQSTIRVIRTMP
jgi:hypothetical protein